ncbi:MAG: sodium:calcium antiporter [Planctomycetaceae bacterium]|nr:sodium:calcium antiporter [Planctomycetaceae bacterium]
MLESSVQFAVCAFIIVVAGTLLTRFADAIAEITKLGRLVIGSVLLAGTTSLPEITVDISAIRMGMPDIAVGDLLGSSLANLAILALLDLSNHSQGKMLSRQAAAHALSGSLSAALTAIVGIGLLTGKALAEYAVFGVSPICILVAVVYAFGARMIYLDQRIAMKEVPPEEPGAHPGMTLGKAALGFAVCGTAILIAGPYLASAAGRLAEETGLGKTFVGSTLVAFSTSLPELVSSLAALRLGAIDLAIGNVFGSNAFNMIILLPLDAIEPGPLFATVAPTHAVTCVAAILATMIAIMGQLYRAETRVRFIEPDAWLIIACVIGAMALLYYLPAL